MLPGGQSSALHVQLRLQLGQACLMQLGWATLTGCITLETMHKLIAKQLSWDRPAVHGPGSPGWLQAPLCGQPSEPKLTAY